MSRGRGEKGEWLNIFLVRSFSYRQINLTWKANLLSILRGKYCLIHLEIVKIPKKIIIMLPPTPTQLYLVWIRFRRKISFVTSFTIFKWLKKYYIFNCTNILFIELLTILFGKKYNMIQIILSQKQFILENFWRMI